MSTISRRGAFSTKVSGGDRCQKCGVHGDSLKSNADDVAQDNHSGGGQAGSDLLAHKVVQGGVGGDLGVLPRTLAHHVNGCSAIHPYD